MTSPKKKKANRANARASTGPKTAEGKGCSAQNAGRHGLSLAVVSDPALAEEVKSLAREIVGEESDNEICRLAQQIAEAHIDLMRVRQARHDLLARNVADPDYGGNKARNFAAIAGLIALRNAMGMPLKTNLTSDQLAKGQVKPEDALKRLRALQRPLPPGFKFDREEAHER